MRFAFALYRYFPYGGLQRDMFRMLQEALDRGHTVDLFFHEWLGTPPSIPGVKLIRLKASGWSNHGKMSSFGKHFLKAVRQNGAYDCIVTFNRIPGGDLYFAADNCLASEWGGKHSSFMLKFLPRYRTFLRQEAEVCRSPKCRIMCITARQKTEYQQSYSVPEERFIKLPPGMNPACRRPVNAEEIRREVRRKEGIPETEVVLISVGQDIRRKGFDRAILAFASLPEERRKKSRLLIVGQDPSPEITGMVQKTGVAERVFFPGVRDDVPELLLASDLMIHPARSESAGSVLIEGIAAGIPVIATAACGFSPFVAEVDPECVIPEPFRQETLNQTLLHALTRLDSLKARTMDYAAKTDFCRRASVAVDAMEETGMRAEFLCPT